VKVKIGCNIQNCVTESRIQNPESRIQNPESNIQHPALNRPTLQLPRIKKIVDVTPDIFTIALSTRRCVTQRVRLGTQRSID
jgi:hypothetical protein